MKLGKKLLSLLTVLCLTLSLFPTMALADDGVSVGDTPNRATSVTVGSATLNSNTPYLVKGEKAAQQTITSEEESKGYIQFTSNGQITLNNYAGSSEINATSDLTINLVGKNTITTPGANSIYSTGALTITSSSKGSLTAENLTSGSVQTTIYSTSDITITGNATVTATINGTAQAINSHSENGKITIADHATVTATNTNNTATTENGIAILAGNSTNSTNSSGGTIEVKDSATLTAKGYGKALACQTFTVTGYTVKASADYNATNPGEYVAESLATYKYITATPAVVNYDVWVGNKQVTSANKDNVLGVTNANGTPTVTYTPDTNTLTLNGVTITNTTENTSGIKASNDLTIALIGENNTISGTGHAIEMTNGTLTITGPGSLNASSSSGQTTIYTQGSGDVIINGGAQITAENTSNGMGDAIHLEESNKNLTVTGNGTQLIARKTEGKQTAINGVDTLAVSDGAKLTAQSNGTAISCTTFSPGSNSSVKVAGNYNGTGANDYSNSANLNSYKYVAVQPKGTTSTTYTVTLTSGTGYTLSAAQDPSSPVTSGGSYSFTLDIADSYKRGNNFAVKANGSELTAGADGKYTISNIRENQTITVEGVVEITKYQVWVNGTQVTEANKDNVLQDNTATHSVVYAPADDNNPATLTLTNASIKNQQISQSGGLSYILPCGIAAKENLKVIVCGENNIIESANGNAIRGECDLTICGNGSLKLTSYNTAVTISVQDSHNLAVTESVKITATKKNSNNQLDGRTIAANDITVQGNANVTAIN